MDPRTAMVVNLVLVGLGGAVAAISADSSAGSSVTTWAGMIGAVVAAINTALHATSSSQAGPLGK